MNFLQLVYKLLPKGDLTEHERHKQQSPRVMMHQIRLNNIWLHIFYSKTIMLVLEKVEKTWIRTSYDPKNRGITNMDIYLNFIL
jgi:hypothetical protein